MEPFVFKSQVKARLIGLKQRNLGPANLDDVMVFQETRRRDKFLVQTADKKTRESRDLLFSRSGAKLRFEVLFELLEKSWTITRYSFHFDGDGKWFRYDLDPDLTSGLAHPLAHLHVNHDEPRYPTAKIQSPLDLLEFLDAQGLLNPPMTSA